jgi:tetratricopeptide (TPR) repeat protein
MKRTVRRRPYKRIALAVGIIAGLTGWLIVWPEVRFRQARQQLTENPQRAAQLLEQLVDESQGDYPAAQLLWTRALLKSGQRDEALGCFSYIRQPATLDVNELLTLTDEALAAGVPLLAAFAVNAVPAGGPRWPDALERQQALCQLQGDWPRVIGLGTELTTLDPQRAAAWQRLGEAHEHLMNPPQAAIAYRQFLELERDPAARQPALARMVRLAIELGDNDVARQAYAELTANRRPTPEEQLLEAKLLRLEGRVDDAWSAVQGVLESLPNDLSSLELRGTLALDRGELDEARRDLQTVVDRQAWNKPAHYKLGQVLIRLGQPEEARRHLAENRRLTALSLRILDLQAKTATGQAEIDRLTELAAAFEQLGQRETAARLRHQARQLPR